MMAPILGGYINIYRRTVRVLNEAGGAYVHVLWKKSVGIKKGRGKPNTQRRQILQYGYKSVKLNSERTLEELWKKTIIERENLED